MKGVRDSTQLVEVYLVDVSDAVEGSPPPSPNVAEDLAEVLVSDRLVYHMDDLMPSDWKALSPSNIRALTAGRSGRTSPVHPRSESPSIPRPREPEPPPPVALRLESGREPDGQKGTQESRSGSTNEVVDDEEGKEDDDNGFDFLGEEPATNPLEDTDGWLKYCKSLATKSLKDSNRSMDELEGAV